MQALLKSLKSVLAELNAALCPDTRAKKWKYKFKQIFHLLEWGLNPQPVNFTVTLCAPALRPASLRLMILKKSYIILVLPSDNR